MNLKGNFLTPFSTIIDDGRGIHSRESKKSLEERYRINLLYDLFEHGLEVSQSIILNI